MDVSFSTHSVHQTLIKVYQCSLTKQPTEGSTWDWVILQLHYDLRPSGTYTEYGSYLSNKIYMYIL
jgi:hypothetical protein